jgi:ubiquinone/menaquinone biosynthesis C-methylase UbiE
MRQPFQGILNIIRFNWHFYLIAIVAIVLIQFSIPYLPSLCQILARLFCLSIILSTTISLLVSLYVYDLSGLYKLPWLTEDSQNQNIININAGFDETSLLLKSRFPNGSQRIFDFYNPQKHTEVSIERARNAYPAQPNTQQILTNHIPLPDKFADKVILIFAAHEIREEQERIQFFQEINRILKPEGEVIVTEHLRDIPNFIAYNIGFLHFHSKSTWYSTFKNANLTIQSETKYTPFITTFKLKIKSLP